MSKLEKLYLKVKNNPKAVRFEELNKILLAEGFKMRQPGKGSSHYIYKRGDVSITIPRRKPFVLEKYVREIIKIVEGRKVK